MRDLFSLLLLLLMLALACVGGFIFGWHQSQSSQQRMEASVIHGFLTNTKEHPQRDAIAREFLKARCYFLLSETDSHHGLEFGPINLNLLSGHLIDKSLPDLDRLNAP